MNNSKGDKMNKSELIEAIAHEAGVTKAAAGGVLDALIATVKKVLKAGGQVSLPGLGSFATVHRSARKGRNPQTGQVIDINAARVAKFKVGKALKEAVQK